MNCTCHRCQQACLRRPGFFALNELKPVADFLKVSVKELFRKYLRVDYGIHGDMPFMAVTPVTTNSQPGTFAPQNPTGSCVFFKNGACSIHEVKPAECKFWDHSKTPEQSREFRETLMSEWAKKSGRKQLQELLGVGNLDKALQKTVNAWR